MTPHQLSGGTPACNTCTRLHSRHSPWSCCKMTNFCLLMFTLALWSCIEIAIVGWMTHGWTWHANKQEFTSKKGASKQHSGQTGEVAWALPTLCLATSSSWIKITPLLYSEESQRDLTSHWLTNERWPGLTQLSDPKNTKQLWLSLIYI